MREANLKRTAMASPGLRRLASLAALAMCVALAATGRAAADSGETGQLSQAIMDGHNTIH